MSKNLKYKLVISGTAVLGSALPALAANESIQNGATSAQGDLSNTTLQDQIKNVTNTLLFVIGVAAVIMLIVGGFNYIFSAGNPDAAKRARETILFAIIGIVVAMLALGIVNFVIGRF